MYFLYAICHSFVAIVDEPSQKIFSHYLRKISQESYKTPSNKTVKIDRQKGIPDAGLLVTSYFVDNDRWVSWKDFEQRFENKKELSLELSYNELVVPTTEYNRNINIIQFAIKNKMPTLFVGPTGTGKSLFI